MAQFLKLAPRAVAAFCLLALAVGCKSRSFNTKSGVRDTGSTPSALPAGIPAAMTQGVTSNLRDIIALNDKGATPHTFSYQGSSFTDGTDSVEVERLNGYYGQAFRAKTPISCNTIGKITSGDKIISDDSQKCIFELHSTDKVIYTAANAPKGIPAGTYWGLTIAVVAVDDNGDGFVSSGSFKNSIPAAQMVPADGVTAAGTSKMIRTTKVPVKDASGNVMKDASGNTVMTEVVLPNPDVEIDAAAVSKALTEASAKFSSGSGSLSERNSCLMNFRAKDWTDISAHYYCIFPHDSVRECYSTQLVLGKEKAYAEVVANPLIAAADRNSAMLSRLPGLHVNAWKQCMESSSASADSQWIKANQENVFKYVMMTSTGVIDFNVESEQKAINEFYGDVSKRPRRFTDSYKNWAEDQPRYDVIRQTQQAMIAKLKAAAAAAAAAAGGTSSTAP